MTRPLRVYNELPYMKLFPFILSLSLAIPFPGVAQTDVTKLVPVVVTSVRSKDPLIVSTDAKAPVQPVPAHDGADVLKNIPGFVVIRKGGTDGDPVLRGMAGSRLSILVEGETVLGGCFMRMDPPTAYIFPAAYDRITVIKGPQSVRYGPISSAGLVRFERDFVRRDDTGATMFSTVTAGSFGRLDGALDLRGGNSSLQGRIAATYSEMGDYVDGDDQTVHSSYQRWSTNASLAWTPNDDSFIEITGALSDGEAAYADRMMDGALFDRNNIGLRMRRSNISDLVQEIEFQAYANAVDHVMDNYSLRTFTPTMMMRNKTVSNPDRLTTGARLALSLTPVEKLKLDTGIDYQGNRHRVRATMNQDTMPYENKARIEDVSFDQIGAFAEAAYTINDHTRFYAGARIDQWTAQDKRAAISLGMMGGSSANPTANLKRESTLPGAFARVEHDISKGSTVYLGVGHTQRFPDYWELVSSESTTSPSAFHTAPEKTTQVDLGWLYRNDALELTASVFASGINDFILIQNSFPKSSIMMGGMMSTRMATVARNIDAKTIGGEFGLGYRFTEAFRIDASLSTVRGDNTRDDRPLAQMPPLEGRIGFTYTRSSWSVGALWHGVVAQDRVAINQGNIVGQDIGPSPAYDTVSLNASWAPTSYLRFSIGIDNLFDRTYAAHISRAGAAVAGFTQTTRVNEPGRFIWIKCDYRF